MTLSLKYVDSFIGLTNLRRHNFQSSFQMNSDESVGQLFLTNEKFEECDTFIKTFSLPRGVKEQLYLHNAKKLYTYVERAS